LIGKSQGYSIRLSSGLISCMIKLLEKERWLRII
jgi:hypothetical protein